MTTLGTTRAARPRLVRHAALLCTVVVAGCELGAKETVQVGYRGVGQEINFDVSKLKELQSNNVVPDPLPPLPPGPAPAWRNVQVLTDLSTGEFNRTMIAMSNWVAPKTGANASCAYCHDLNNLAADRYPDGREIYTKIVARRMLQMNREINRDWKSAHVGYTGVTCYTCHRGEPVPNGIWFYTDENQYLRHYLDRDDARVQSRTVAPSNVNRSSIKQTEYTYALMMSMSRGLGVNCTYCHNSRQWSAWEQGSPVRVTALGGIQMLRELNTEYLIPLRAHLPPYRLGRMGDAPKAQCVTCHQGAYKPLFGVSMVKDYPALWGQPTWDSVAITQSDTITRGLLDNRGADSVPGEQFAPGQPATSPVTPPGSATRTPNDPLTPRPAPPQNPRSTPR